MRRAFQPCGTTHDLASCKVGPGVWRAVAACKQWYFDGYPPRTEFIRELCEADGVHYPAVLVLVRYLLPTYSNRQRFVNLNQDDRPPPVLVDSPLTAWAILAKNWPVRVRLRLADGRFIKPAQLEDWALTGELD